MAHNNPIISLLKQLSNHADEDQLLKEISHIDTIFPFNPLWWELSTQYEGVIKNLKGRNDTAAPTRIMLAQYLLFQLTGNMNHARVILRELTNCNTSQTNQTQRQK